MTAQADAPSGTIEGFGSKAYRAYVLFALFIVYMFNFIDRTLIGVLGEPIRETFGLSDATIGLLSGPAFALLYTLLGIPCAMLAERVNRGTIIAVAMAMWSAMTVFCGMAGSTLMFALGRVGVGIGESGCSPPSHSLISDYFPPEKRGTALSVYSLGIPIGSMMASLAGAWFATQQGLDWRSAFIWLGAPGILIALIFKLTVKEPPRGYSDPGGVEAAAADRPSPFEVFGVIARKPTFWHVCLGGGLSSFVGYGVGQFTTPFFLRVHGLELMHAALLYGLILGLFAALGTFLSGWIADKIRHRHPNGYSWLPAIGFFISAPAYVIAYNTLSITSGDAALWLAMPFFIVGAVAHYFYLSPMFAVTQNMVSPRMRATASAVLLFMVNIIGYAGGPPVIGWLSDQAAGRQLVSTEAPVSLAQCNGIEQDLRTYRKTAEADRTPELSATAAANSETNATHCAPARADGIRFAVSIGVLIYIWAGLHYLLMGRTLQRDTWRAPGTAARKDEDAPEASAT